MKKLALLLLAIALGAGCTPAQRMQWKDAGIGVGKAAADTAQGVAGKVSDRLSSSQGKSTIEPQAELDARQAAAAPQPGVTPTVLPAVEHGAPAPAPPPPTPPPALPSPDAPRRYLVIHNQSPQPIQAYVDLFTEGKEGFEWRRWGSEGLSWTVKPGERTRLMRPDFYVLEGTSAVVWARTADGKTMWPKRSVQLGGMGKQVSGEAVVTIGPQ